MATPSRFNRGYTGGLAAGSQPGGGFRSSLAAPPPMTDGTPMTPGGKTPQERAIEEMNQPLDLSLPSSNQPPVPAAPDMSNFFGPAPLPSAGQASFTQPPASPFGSAPLPTLGSGPKLNQPPASPFGPEPLPFGGFRARGGPVRPGRAYLVGERGPEMIVPQQPGMVIPNGATPSPMNRGYAPGSLAGRGPTPVGRSIDDPQRQLERLNRIGRQQFGQTGDPSLMLSLNWRNRLGGGSALPMGPPALPGPAPAAPAPSGQLVPGISAGSQVWMRDNPQDVQGNGGTVPMMPPPMTSSMPAPAASVNGAPAEILPPQPYSPPPMPTLPPLPPSMFPPMGQDYGTGLPPSVLSTQGPGAIGLPMGPPVDPKNPRPLIPTPQQVQQFGLQPDFSKPQEYGGKQYPTFRTPKPEENQRWQLYDAPGPKVPHPYIKDLMIDGPPIKRQVDPITGETRDLVEEGTARGAKTPAAAPAADAQAPGWLDWLKQKTTKQS